MNIRFKITVWTLFYLLSAHLLFSLERSVYYTSDSIRAEFDNAGEPEKLFLSGNVKILFGDVVIRCEKASFNRITGEIIAESGVTFENSRGTSSSDALAYNVNEKKGFLTNAVFSVPPLYGKAEKMERDQESVFIHNGHITTCDRELPHYRFAVGKVEYVEGDYLRAEKMKLVFGRKFNVFYFPRITMDLKTKEPPFLLSSGHSARVGKTLDLTFQHRVSREDDIIMKERISVGSGAAGLGAGLESAEKKYKMSAFLAKRRDKDGLEYGIFAEFCKNFPPCGKTGNIILDWRWMYDNDFFYDFFYDVYQVKSKTYNSLYFSRNFSGGILSAALRDDAGEKFLDIEKIPELQFYTPFFQVNGSPVFLENNFSLTNFYKGGDYYLRSMDMLTLKTEKDMGGFLFSPYLSFAGSGYRYPEENRFNVMGEAGTGVSVLLKKEKSFATEYFRPAVSIFYRGLRLERGELEYFDRMEDMNGGKFARTSMDWSFWGREGYLGRIAVENLFDMDRGGFEENLLKYDIRVTRNLHVSGDNKWDMGRKRYLFGVNDLVLDYEKHGYSFGTRYDRDGNISGVAGELRHEVNDAWRYVFKTHYDVEEGSFARQSLECWMKMHCWELNFRITREDEGFSFYVFAYPILL